MCALCCARLTTAQVSRILNRKIQEKCKKMGRMSWQYLPSAAEDAAFVAIFASSGVAPSSEGSFAVPEERRISAGPSSASEVVTSVERQAGAIVIARAVSVARASLQFGGDI